MFVYCTQLITCLCLHFMLYCFLCLFVCLFVCLRLDGAHWSRSGNLFNSHNWKYIRISGISERQGTACSCLLTYCVHGLDPLSVNWSNMVTFQFVFIVPCSALTMLVEYITVFVLLFVWETGCAKAVRLMVMLRSLWRIPRTWSP
jgi:hypothetical protein